VALIAMVSAAVVTGLFDAVLLLAVPSFVIWAALGALWTPILPDERRLQPLIVMILVLLSAAGAVRNAMQIAAMQTYSTRGDRTSLTRASEIDPGNYRLQVRLARIGGRDRCQHARAAHALFPHAQEAIALSRSCK